MNLHSSHFREENTETFHTAQVEGSSIEGEGEGKEKQTN